MTTTTQQSGGVTLADQIAAIDAVETASRIVTRGARAAIGASTVEILAMAKHILQLSTLADLTFDMLSTSDQIEVARSEEERERQRALRNTLAQKVSDVGAALEALGYGQDSTTTTEEEIQNGQG